jgi:hypothetical protein
MVKFLDRTGSLFVRFGIIVTVVVSIVDISGFYAIINDPAQKDRHGLLIHCPACFYNAG